MLARASVGCVRVCACACACVRVHVRVLVCAGAGVRVCVRVRVFVCACVHDTARTRLPQSTGNSSTSMPGRASFGVFDFLCFHGNRFRLN